VIRLLASAACAAAILSAASPAAGDEERFSLTLRGAAFDRDDTGYADHAQVFGLGSPEVGGGGVVEAGVRVLPRLWLVGSWSAFATLGKRRLDALRVANHALLLQLAVTAARVDIDLQGEPTWLRLDLMGGGGLYWISDELDGEEQNASAPGARVGAQVSYGWRALGLSLSYGWHMSRARLEDRLGGALRAGGHELGAGLSLRW